MDNDIVVDAENAQSALDAYRIELATKGSNNSSTDADSLAEKSGIVQRVVVLANGSNTVVSFMLKDDKTVYSVNSNNSPYAIFIKEGDKVTFKANVTADQTAASIQDLTVAGIGEIK